MSMPDQPVKADLDGADIASALNAWQLLPTTFR